MKKFSFTLLSSFFLIFSTAYAYEPGEERTTEDSSSTELDKLYARAHEVKKGESGKREDERLELGRDEILNATVDAVYDYLQELYPNLVTGIDIVDRARFTFSFEAIAGTKTVECVVSLQSYDVLDYNRRESAKYYFPLRIKQVVATVLGEKLASTMRVASVEGPITNVRQPNILRIEFREISSDDIFSEFTKPNSSDARVFVPMRAKHGKRFARLYMYENFNYPVGGLTAVQRERGYDSDVLRALQSPRPYEAPEEVRFY